MTAAPPGISSAVHESLARRALDLGVPLWLCDGAGTILQEPAGPEPLLPWLHSAALRNRIETAARDAVAAPPDRLQPIELWPGCLALPLFEKEGAQRLFTTVALLMTGRLTGAPVFDEICSVAGVDVELMQARTVPFLHSDASAARQLAAVLRWTHDDLVRADRTGRTVEQLGDKLAQAYEQTHLLFRLGRFLAYIDDSPRLMQMVCGQLHQVLPFKWLAIRFNSESAEVPELAGQLIIAGEAPGPRQVIDRLAAPLFEHGRPDDWTRLLDPQRHGLAMLAGSEVLAEPITHDGLVVGALLAGNKEGDDPRLNSDEMQFLDATASFLGIFHENIARFHEQHTLFLGTLSALTAVIEAKDPYTSGHSARVALLAGKMATALGLGRKQAEHYHIAGLVHDLGKIGVPEAALCKAGKLSSDEFAQIKKHPEIGHRILSDLRRMKDVLPGVLHHHERWDGNGYPHRLAGADIPLIARVLALVDAFDAMCSTRSYRPATTPEQARAEILRCSGSQFDPQLVGLFLGLDTKDFEQMLQKPGIADPKAA